MFISEWFNRKYAKIYAAQVKEDIPYLFQWHVLVMRVTGLWPTDDDSRWYKYLTISIFICVGIGFGLSQLVNVLFVHTIERAMDSSFISLAVCATTVKAAIIYWQRNNIRNLFGIHKRFPRANEQAAYTIIIRIQIVMFMVYSTSWFFAVVQSVVADRESALFPSTAFWPHDFAHDRLVYWIVLSMQLVTSVGFCIWVTLADVFYIVLISTACDHLAQLKERLGNLGTTTGRGEDPDFCFYMNLVECCERYEDCLSYASIMSNIMSPTLFMQFGLSGLGLCSSVYVLSVNRPMDDPINFMCVMCYFGSCLSQIFMFSFCGSRLSDESDDITSAIYESQWMDRNEKCKRAYRILVERSMHPITIWAGGLFELSMPTFVRICRAAYSYFNVLRTLEANMN